MENLRSIASQPARRLPEDPVTPLNKLCAPSPEWAAAIATSRWAELDFLE